MVKVAKAVTLAVILFCLVYGVNRAIERDPWIKSPSPTYAFAVWVYIWPMVLGTATLIVVTIDIAFVIIKRFSVREKKNCFNNKKLLWFDVFCLSWTITSYTIGAVNLVALATGSLVFIRIFFDSFGLFLYYLLHVIGFLLLRTFLISYKWPTRLRLLL